MTRRAQFIPYRPKTILNKSKRADHWFWTRYSAYPYIGCQHGCAFCYCREQKYSPFEDIDDFAHVIKVKENAPDLLRKALNKVPVEAIFTGDYQPAERKFKVSRKMLEVCLEEGFPVFILERSPLVLRDLDLIMEIHNRASVRVAFSIICTPESANYARVCQIERLSPAAHKRFEAMEKLAQSGIPTGTCMMPILPGLCDDSANLEAVVRWTAESGGQFVLAGGLTLSDQQRDYYLDYLEAKHPDLLPSYQKLYPEESYTPTKYRWRDIALRVREHCTKYGIRDRMRRPIIPGERRSLNKRIVEYFADQAYRAEVEGEPGYRVWANRKAAWAVEDLEQDIGLVYRSLGKKGLESIPDIGKTMAGKVEELLVKAGETQQTYGG